MHTKGKAEINDASKFGIQRTDQNALLFGILLIRGDAVQIPWAGILTVDYSLPGHKQ